MNTRLLKKSMAGFAGCGNQCRPLAPREEISPSLTKREVYSFILSPSPILVGSFGLLAGIIQSNTPLVSR